MTSRSSIFVLMPLWVSGVALAGHSRAQAPPVAPQQLQWVDRSGTLGDTIGQPQALMTGPVLSSDGGRVLVRAREREGEMDDIWVHGVATPTKTRVTSDPAHERHPDWAPGGDRVVFYSYRNGLADLFTRSADGSGRDEPLVAVGSTHEYGPSWSPDGRTIAFHSHDPKTDKRALMYMTVDGVGRIESFLPGAAGIAMPRFSPDGRYIAYVSNESGLWEVYVRAFPSGTESWKISSGGGMWPKWCARTNELFFFDGTALMAVTVQENPFKSSPPSRVFTGAQVGLAGSTTDVFNPLFDVAADGRRFVIVRSAGQR